MEGLGRGGGLSKKGKLERAHQDMKYTNDNDVVKYTQMCHYIMLAYLGGLNGFWITI